MPGKTKFDQKTKNDIYKNVIIYLLRLELERAKDKITADDKKNIEDVKNMNRLLEFMSIMLEIYDKKGEKCYTKNLTK
jgi:hypothetical protein